MTSLDRVSLVVMTYGERFRHIRLRIATNDDRVIALARKLGKGYPSTVYNIEARWRPPNLKTIEKHAVALGCEPWDLLEGVETEYDLAKQIGKIPNKAMARDRWKQLVGRSERAVERPPGRASPKVSRGLATVQRRRMSS